MKYFKRILILLSFFFLLNNIYYSQNFDLWDVQSVHAKGYGEVIGFFEDNFSNDIYSVFPPSGIKKSSDNGKTWKLITESIEGVNLTCITADANGTLFAGTDVSGIYFSNDNGVSWNALNEGLIDNSGDIIISFIKVDEQNNVFTGAPSGLFKLDRTNSSWNYIDTKAMPGPRLSPSDQPSNLFVGASGFIMIGFNAATIFYSLDYGETWQQSPVPWSDDRWEGGREVKQFIQASENKFYVFTQGNLILIDFRLFSSWVQSLAVDTPGIILDEEKNLLYIHRDGYLMKSVDKGITWNRTESENSFFCLLVYQTKNGNVLISTINSGAYLSEDYCNTFIPVDASERWDAAYFNGLAIDSNDNLYLPIDNELKRSTDEGVTWTTVPLDAEIAITYVYSNKEGFILAGDSHPDRNVKLFMSFDDGATWNKSIIESGEEGFQSVIKVGETILIAFGQQNCSLWKSDDNGNSWTEVSTGYNNTRFSDIVKDNEDNIYVATGGIVLKSEDLGDSWTNITTWEFDPMRWIQNLYITEDNSVLTFSWGAYNYSPTDYSVWYQSNKPEAHGQITQDAQGVLHMGTCYTGFLDGKFWLNTSLLNINYGEMICVDIDKSGNLYAAGNGSVVKCKRNTNSETLPKPTNVLYANREDHIKLYWSDNYNNEDGFIIMRRRDDTVLYDSIATVGANATNYQDFSADMNFDYSYRVMAFNQQNYSLPSEEATFTTDIEDNGIPCNWTLEQNYPNPFNPVTTINYAIPKAGFVSLKIYDMLGNEISSLVNEVKLPGNYKVMFDGSNLSSGLYFAKLVTSEYSNTIKMLLIK